MRAGRLAPAPTPALTASLKPRPATFTQEPRFQNNMGGRVTPGGGEGKRRGASDRISMLLSCANSPQAPNTDAHGHTGGPTG